MRITCISALKIEISWLLGRLGKVSRTVGPIGPLWRGVFQSHEIDCLLCGAGPEKCRQRLERLDLSAGTELIIHLGICGALDPGLELGRPLLAETVKAAWAPEEAPLALYLPEHLSYAELTPELIPLRGTILTQHSRIESLRERQALRESFGADCVDQEAWEVARYCAGRNILLIVVKAVSDRSDADLAAGFPERAARAAQAAGKVVLSLLLDI
ncbi:MAG: hypothetical protein A2Z86_04120 [Candidatus Glassbacteria bacterium GWA2_58_10]|uniref:Nucleoside phosphorylase domain-containing protein n=1 Tax=Candidatus Glassbacteria bacterium GWA2_58_10 TaxID=1817865 RepID=A0A1F5YFC3_9BACT|nr:MAG: hypothetical protein A2Z86_04120 [Candidatus Glassbacteria bacterium GWA2_58_10]